jgi:hypothetical protein
MLPSPAVVTTKESGARRARASVTAVTTSCRPQGGTNLLRDSGPDPGPGPEPEPGPGPEHGPDRDPLPLALP